MLAHEFAGVILLVSPYLVREVRHAGDDVAQPLLNGAQKVSQRRVPRDRNPVYS